MLRSSQSGRAQLYEHYARSISVNPDLDRTLVSFQANKREAFYKWFRFKEGFSSRLVQYCIRKLARGPGDLLDPFAGAGASLFASINMGWNATGIEILPVCLHAMKARESVYKLGLHRFLTQLRQFEKAPLESYSKADYFFPHISITHGAFTPHTEKQIGAYLSYCHQAIEDSRVRELFEFACFCVLEEVSYTRKDGQYLRWDHRSPKNQGTREFDKGKIPSFNVAVRRKLAQMAADLAEVHSQLGLTIPRLWTRGRLEVIDGSCLDVLPEREASSVDFVVTSPPYCNRYDYTRTYALELAFLGYNDDEVKRLRQKMLSCTVENKEKKDELREDYETRGLMGRFRSIERTFNTQEALHEVLDALERLRGLDALNNSNIPRMVRNYFYEMCFVIFELARLLRRGGRIVMVNDNVRYAGEEVPVDLILSDFANSFGLRVREIWTLPRGKGNSSQQMGSHGRQELRKCVYIWEKP